MWRNIAAEPGDATALAALRARVYVPEPGDSLTSYAFQRRIPEQ
jgi:hypothetical protein